MNKSEINYQKYLLDYSELLFGSGFDSSNETRKNRIRLFYYKLLLRNVIHLIRSLNPVLIKIVINMTREMGFRIFSEYIGLNFYIIDRMRQKELARKAGW